MIIDSISVRGKRVIIKSGETEHSIHMDTYLSFSFDVGDDVDIEEILFDSNKRDAISKAIGYASRKMLTRKELSDKLRKLDFDLNVIEYCLEKLEEYNYIDDVKYAELYAESKSKSKGSLYIRNKLREKGVSSDIVGRLYIEEDIGLMKDILIKKYGAPREISYDEKSKMIRFLCTRGYLTSNSVKAVEMYVDSRE